jgi:hypothetical protein
MEDDIYQLNLVTLPEAGGVFTTLLFYEPLAYPGRFTVVTGCNDAE